jgi:hypothetical protein
VAAKQAASIKAGVNKVAGSEIVKLPTVQGSGRPVGKITSIDAGGNWNRGGKKVFWHQVDTRVRLPVQPPVAGHKKQLELTDLCGWFRSPNQ